MTSITYVPKSLWPLSATISRIFPGGQKSPSDQYSLIVEFYLKYVILVLYFRMKCDGAGWTAMGVCSLRNQVRISSHMATKY